VVSLKFQRNFESWKDYFLQQVFVQFLVDFRSALVLEEHRFDSLKKLINFFFELDVELIRFGFCFHNICKFQFQFLQFVSLLLSIFQNLVFPEKFFLFGEDL
jgi:hypothetical protein